MAAGHGRRHHRSMSDHTSTSAPGGDSSSRPRPAPGQGFFDWVRRLGVQRGDAWIGGVCGGVGARLGIDPMIVRGIAVVVALLGGPAFLLYALAWLLLPDTQGTIHLERLIGGVFEAATAGVIVFVLLAFLPIAQGVWWAAGWPFGAGVGLAESLGKVFWSAAVIAGIVALVVWLSRRRGGFGGWGPSPWPGAGPAGYGADAGAGAATGTDTDAGTMSEADRGAGSATAANTSADAAQAGAGGAWVAGDSAAPAPRADIVDWRVRQAEWRERYDAWRLEQAQTAQQRREQRQAQSAESAKWQAEAFERARLRRQANPRTSGAFVAAALGTALIAGAIAAALSWSDPALHAFQAVFGFAAATAVIGLSMMVAGLARRRSGFLAFVAIVLTVITALLIAGAGLPSIHDLFPYPLSVILP
jgi:phage shock protein PspC (stress-responsive transcriptional regulator)